MHDAAVALGAVCTGAAKSISSPDSLDKLDKPETLTKRSNGWADY
jgi:hypothetical protein